MPVYSSLLASGVFAFLVYRRNSGVLAYLRANSHIFTSQSLKVIIKDDAFPLLLIALFILTAWGFGRRIMAAWQGKHAAHRNKSFMPLIEFGLGLGVFSSGLFVLGIMGLLHPVYVIVWLLLAAILALPHSRKALHGPISISFESFSIGKSLLAGLLIYFIWNALICDLAPPIAWDTLAYHLAIPKIYAQHGQITEIPWLLVSHWPHLTEVLYALPLLFGNDTLPALLHGSLLGALILATFLATKEYPPASPHAKDHAPWIAAALLACQPMLCQEATMAANDGALAFFCFLSALSLYEWSSSNTATNSWLITGGLLAGMAAATKLFGVTLLCIWTAWIVWHSMRQGKKTPWRNAGIFLGFGMIVVIPWFLKTWAGTGDPVYPFLSQWFNGRLGAPWLAPAFFRIQSWTWRQLPSAMINEGSPYLLVPFLAAAIAAAYERRRWPPIIKFLLIPAIPYMLSVAHSTSAWRYCLPLMPIFAMAIAWEASHLLEKNNFWAKAGTVLILAFGLSPILQTSQNNELFAVLGLRSVTQPSADSRTLYLSRSLDNYQFFQKVNESLPSSAKILLFREVRGYYLRPDYQWGDPVNQGLIHYAGIPDARGLWSRLGELGISHVLINEGLPIYQVSRDYYTPHSVNIMREMLGQHSHAVLKEGRLTLFELMK